LGKNTGQVLERYFQNRNLGLKTVESHVVRHLQAERPRNWTIWTTRCACSLLKSNPMVKLAMN
jgi:hypothetical protein